MTEIRYVLTHRQRVFYLVAGGIFAALGALNTVFGGAPTFLAIGIAFCVYYFLFKNYGAVLTAEGLQMRGLTTKVIPWQQIQAVETYNMLGTTGVKLRLVDGGTKRLRAPVRGFGQPDPEFDTKLATIRQWWQHYTGQPVVGA